MKLGQISQNLAFSKSYLSYLKCSWWATHHDTCSNCHHHLQGVCLGLNKPNSINLSPLKASQLQPPLIWVCGVRCEKVHMVHTLWCCRSSKGFASQWLLDWKWLLDMICRLKKCSHQQSKPNPDHRPLIASKLRIHMARSSRHCSHFIRLDWSIGFKCTVLTLLHNYVPSCPINLYQSQLRKLCAGWPFKAAKERSHHAVQDSVDGKTNVAQANTQIWKGK